MYIEKLVLEIAETAQTYKVVGNMNEHQLTITESTWTCKEELVDTTGIIDYGSLIYITLQRAKTAREAIKIMTDLVAEYGYNSHGESFSIGDPNEIWVMEMCGKGGKELQHLFGRNCTRQAQSCNSYVKMNYVNHWFPP